MKIQFKQHKSYIFFSIYINVVNPTYSHLKNHSLVRVYWIFWIVAQPFISTFRNWANEGYYAIILGRKDPFYIHIHSNTHTHTITLTWEFAALCWKMSKFRLEYLKNHIWSNIFWCSVHIWSSHTHFTCFLV